jgi:polynucleotide 5'-kinase involved in rRNA processing
MTQDVKASGLVINTAGWIDNQGFQLLLHAIEVSI